MQDEQGTMQKRGGKPSERTERGQGRKGDARYGEGCVYGMPMCAVKGYWEQNVVESEERLMAYNWQRGRTCEAV